jgi:hypothetical protein
VCVLGALSVRFSKPVVNVETAELRCASRPYRATRKRAVCESNGYRVKRE